MMMKLPYIVEREPHDAADEVTEVVPVGAPVGLGGDLGEDGGVDLVVLFRGERGSLRGTRLRGRMPALGPAKDEATQEPDDERGPRGLARQQW